MSAAAIIPTLLTTVTTTPVFRLTQLRSGTYSSSPEFSDESPIRVEPESSPAIVLPSLTSSTLSATPSGLAPPARASTSVTVVVASTLYRPGVRTKPATVTRRRSATSIDGLRRNGVYAFTRKLFSESADIPVTRTDPIFGNTASPFSLTANSPDRSGSLQILSLTPSPGRSCSPGWASGRTGGWRGACRRSVRSRSAPGFPDRRQRQYGP